MLDLERLTFFYSTLDGGSGICASSRSFHEGLLELHGYHCGQLCSHLFLPYNCVSSMLKSKVDSIESSKRLRRVLFDIVTIFEETFQQAINISFM